MLQRVYANSQHLLGLINQILDLSKIEAGRLELVSEPITLRKLVEQWRAQVSVLAEDKLLAFNIQVDDTLPETLYGDAERLSQITINLLSNAIKFTTKGSVTLALRAAGSEWLMEVTDTGMGIPPHALDVIFEQFRQVDASSSRSQGGTGLGLTIVRNLARLMGGTVSVQSTVGVGSTFTVRLPLVSAAHSETLAPRPATQPIPVRY
jgi:signal transduction histidine kinase